MDWIGRFRASLKAKLVERRDETVIEGAADDARKAVRGNSTDRTAASLRPDAQIAAEIKRRQVSLAVRYVIAIRAR